MNLLSVKTLSRLGWGFLGNFTPFTAWIRELGDKQVLKADIVAGGTVALVLVPQSLAYANLAGLPASAGLYASFLPVAIAAFFGSSRQLATGPVAVVSLLTASALAPLAVSGTEEYIAYATLLALMVGVFQLALGFFRLGIMVAFLSHPVVIGFTNAAAIVIATSQLGKIFGVSVEPGQYHFVTVWKTVEMALTDTHWPTLVMAALAFSLMLFVKRNMPKVPFVMVAVALTIVLSWGLRYGGHGGAIVGEIPSDLPGLHLPPVMDIEAMAQMLIIAVAISLIGFLEAVSVSKAVATQTRQRLNSDQELIGQGLSNVASSLFQGYAVSGSFSRTAVNHEAGARTGFSSVVTALLVATALLFFTPLLYHLPQATLAAVIMMAVINLLQFKPIVHSWRALRHDGWVAIFTFVMTLGYAPHFEISIIIGILLSLGLYVYRTMHPHIFVMSRDPSGDLQDAGTKILQLCPKIVLLRFEGALFFVNTNYFEERVFERTSSMPDLRFIIIDTVAISEIDATGEHSLRELTRQLVESGIHVLFARAPAPIMGTFRRTGFASDQWADQFFDTIDGALKYAWNALKKEGGECSTPDCDTRDLKRCVLRRRPTRTKMLDSLYKDYFSDRKPGPTAGSGL